MCTGFLVSCAISKILIYSCSFLEQRLLALETRYGRELQGFHSEKQQLQELVERQSRLVSQLQGELGRSTLNSSLLQRQQAALTDTVQQLLATRNRCDGEDERNSLLSVSASTPSDSIGLLQESFHWLIYCDLVTIALTLFMLFWTCSN